MVPVTISRVTRHRQAEANRRRVTTRGKRVSRPRRLPPSSRRMKRRTGATVGILGLLTAICSFGGAVFTVAGAVTTAVGGVTVAWIEYRRDLIEVKRTGKPIGRPEKQPKPPPPQPELKPVEPQGVKCATCGEWVGFTRFGVPKSHRCPPATPQSAPRKPTEPEPPKPKPTANGAKVTEVLYGGKWINCACGKNVAITNGKPAPHNCQKPCRNCNGTGTITVNLKGGRTQKFYCPTCSTEDNFGKPAGPPTGSKPTSKTWPPKGHNPKCRAKSAATCRCPKGRPGAKKQMS